MLSAARPAAYSTCLPTGIRDGMVTPAQWKSGGPRRLNSELERLRQHQVAIPLPRYAESTTPILPAELKAEQAVRLRDVFLFPYPLSPPGLLRFGGKQLLLALGGGRTWGGLRQPLQIQEAHFGPQTWSPLLQNVFRTYIFRIGRVPTRTEPPLKVTFRDGAYEGNQFASSSMVCRAGARWADDV